MRLIPRPVTTQGVLSSRPAAAAAGNRYYVTGDSTAANNSREWLDTGSVWVPATPSVMPIGAMMQWAGSGDPEDFDSTVRWLVCDGRAISRTTYAALFAALATTYGTGDGSTTFNIPDLRGRVPIGVESGTYALAASGGEATHTLSSGEMPVHSHGVSDPTHGHGLSAHVPATSDPINNVLAEYNGTGYNVAYSNAGFGAVSVDAAATGISIQNAGSGGAHNNLQPYLAVNHILRVL